MVRNKFIAFSYITGRKLGKFRSLSSVFRKFPKERIAFNRVKAFNKMSKFKIKTIRQIR